MDASSIAAQIEHACRALGLDDKTLSDTLKQASAMGAEIHRPAVVLAQANERLRADLEKAQAEKERLAALHGEIAELIGASSPDQVLHDLRNLLNELTLLKAVAKNLFPKE